MKKTLVAAAMMAGMGMQGTASAAPVVIDDWMDEYSVNLSSRIDDPVNFAGQSQTTTEDLGDKDRIATVENNAAGNVYSIAEGLGFVEFNSSNSATGYLTVEYDFDAPTNLLDCGANDCNVLQIYVKEVDQSGMPYYIEFEFDGGKTSRLSSETNASVEGSDPIANIGEGFANFYLEFFTYDSDVDIFDDGFFFDIDNNSGANDVELVDFEVVTGLNLYFQGGNPGYIDPFTGNPAPKDDIDATFGKIQTNFVPVPAPVALLGIGGLMAGFMARRRKA